MNYFKRQSEVNEYCIGYLYFLYKTVTLKMLFLNIPNCNPTTLGYWEDHLSSGVQDQPGEKFHLSRGKKKKVVIFLYLIEIGLDTNLLVIS